MLLFLLPFRATLPQGLPLLKLPEIDRRCFPYLILGLLNGSDRPMKNACEHDGINDSSRPRSAAAAAALGPTPSITELQRADQNYRCV
jgi:hypothetical protein